MLGLAAALAVTVELSGVITKHIPDDPLDPTSITTVVEPNKHFCTGFVAYSKGQDEVVVTARHCASTQDITSIFGTVVGDVTPKPTRILFHDGDTGTVQHIYTSKAYDVALLRIHTTRSHPYAMLSNTWQQGMPVTDIGMSAGYDWSVLPATVTQGPIRDRTPGPSNNTYMIAGAGIEGGCSGGPVFDDAGLVVGILVAGDGSGMNFVVPAQDIEQELLAS